MLSINTWPYKNSRFNILTENVLLITRGDKYTPFVHSNMPFPLSLIQDETCILFAFTTKSVQKVKKKKKITHTAEQIQ